QGRPVGQSLGHTLGDAPAWAYPLLWAFGGAETDPSGRTVVLNSKGALESVRWMTAFWREACDEGALAWDDTNNNRAFHAGEISATLNGASIYIYAKRNPDKIRDERGQAMVRDISHFAIPDGTVATPGYHIPASHALMRYSRNQKAAQEFLRWLHGKEQFGRWFEVQEGYSVGATRFWQAHPVWERVDRRHGPHLGGADPRAACGRAAELQVVEIRQVVRVGADRDRDTELGRPPRVRVLQVEPVGRAVDLDRLPVRPRGREHRLEVDVVRLARAEEAAGRVDQNPDARVLERADDSRRHLRAALREPRAHGRQHDVQLAQ